MDVIHKKNQSNRMVDKMSKRTVKQEQGKTLQATEQEKISNVETETTENDTINIVVENKIQSVENTEQGENMNEQKTTGTEQEQKKTNVLKIAKNNNLDKNYEKIINKFRTVDMSHELTVKEQAIFTVIYSMLNSSNNDGYVFTVKSIRKRFFNYSFKDYTDDLNSYLATVENVLNGNSVIWTHHEQEFEQIKNRQPSTMTIILMMILL